MSAHGYPEFKLINVTVYATKARTPLVGTEHYPDGCAGVLVMPVLGSLTATQALELADDFRKLASLMSDPGRRLDEANAKLNTATVTALKGNVGRRK